MSLLSPVGGGNNDSVCSADVALMREASISVFQQLGSNFSIKQHARKRSQLEKRHDPTSVLG